MIMGIEVCSCGKVEQEEFSLSAERRAADALAVGDRVPDVAENEVVGSAPYRISRRSADWRTLVRCQSQYVVFKDEERTGADSQMTSLLCARLKTLGKRVARKWPELRLRVTEAWDEDGEHGRGSLHYEGRAADITVSDTDVAKLGQLGQLAVEAGFDWVYYEDRSHVHVSVKRTK
jgi:hypothetical protein